MIAWSVCFLTMVIQGLRTASSGNAIDDLQKDDSTPKVSESIKQFTNVENHPYLNPPENTLSPYSKKKDDQATAIPTEEDSSADSVKETLLLAAPASHVTSSQPEQAFLWMRMMEIWSLIFVPISAASVVCIVALTADISSIPKFSVLFFASLIGLVGPCWYIAIAVDRHKTVSAF